MLVNILLVALGALTGAAIVVALWFRDRQRLVAEAARLSAEQQAAARAMEAQRAELAERQAQLREAFTALSRAALRENREDFLTNAQALLTPMRDTLDRVARHLVDVDRAREGSFQAVTSQLGLLQVAQDQLRATAEGLSRSLSSPNVRGTWGEIQLRRIVELAGMLPFCDFVEKQTMTADSGARQTPDLLIKLPGNATIVVDAKVPIQAYREAMNAREASERDALLAAHVRQVREHIRGLSAKEYWRQFAPAPDFVVMFMPLEPLLAAALERDESLLDTAAHQRVIPATPLTLLALLKAVASGWRQQQLAENAEEIQQLGRDLYDRLATMVGHLEDLGHSLQAAGQSYDRFVGSLERKVLPGARRFKELGVSSTKSVDELGPIGMTVRPVVHPELTAE